MHRSHSSLLLSPHTSGWRSTLCRAARAQGRTVDFKNTLIIMTSNVGSSVIEKGGGGLGFQLDTSEEDSSYNRIKTLVNEELKQYFRPEFLNRRAHTPPPLSLPPHATRPASKQPCAAVHMRAKK